MLKFLEKNRKFAILGEISGYNGGKYEEDCLLGCCAV
jgi:hypothetical protein